MEYRSLGRTGLKVSAIGLGTNSFGARADTKTSMGILDRAVEAGVTLIDTANIYTDTRSEAIIGEALATSLKAERDRLIIATKAGLRAGDGPNESGSSRLHLIRELEGSLKRLRVDHVDLLQVHTWDPETPLEETLHALDAVVRSGKARYVGCSNYRAWETMKAMWVSDRHHLIRYQSAQVSYSLADRVVEREIIPACLDQGLGFIAYYPLAGGILSGKYGTGSIPEGSRAQTTPSFKRRLKPAYLDLARTVADIASELNASPAQVALAWLIGRPGVSSAIAGATTVSHVDQNVGAADLTLPEPVLERLEEASASFVFAPHFGDARL